METTRYMAAEMKWQVRLLTVGGALLWNESKEEVVHYAGLLVFSFLDPKYQYIQLVHSMAKFLHLTAMLDINNKVVGFIGDRDRDKKPYAVLIQEKKAWNLARLNVIADEKTMHANYADEANVENYGPP